MSGSLRILIVDDHPVVRQGLKQTLADASEIGEIVEAATPHEALDLVRQREWDAVILDIGLPGRGGLEVLKDITFRLAPASSEDALSMLDGIQAAEILRGVRGAKPVDRAALSSMIERVSSLVSDFPEISEMDLNPVFATERGATAADVRIVLNFNPAPARDRPSQAAIVEKMNRIMKPKALAVIGASAENGKIGNSVMKNLINGG